MRILYWVIGAFGNDVGLIFSKGRANGKLRSEGMRFVVRCFMVNIVMKDSCE